MSLFPLIDAMEGDHGYVSPGFLDCGAHSVDTGTWDVLPVADYQRFCETYHQYFRLLAAPDVIGDSKQTEINTIKFAKDIEGKIPLKKLIPIYHLQARSMKEMKRMTEYASDIGSEFIAIGGALGVGWNTHDKQLALKEAFKFINRDKFQVHLLGIVKPKPILEFKPESVDSSYIIHQAKYLRTYRVNEDYTFESVHCDKRLDQAAHNELVMREFARIFPMLGMTVDMEELAHCISRTKIFFGYFLASAMNLLYLEMRIRAEHNYKFTYYISFVNYLRAMVGSLLQDMYKEFWTPRALFTYHRFHGMDDLSVSKELTGLVDPDLERRAGGDVPPSVIKK